MKEFFPVMLALLGIIALMLAVIYGMKWLNNRIRGKNGGGRAIKVTDCVGIGQDKSLMAVKAGRKNLLIGVTPSSISLICELDSEDMAAIEAEKPSDRDMAGKSFSECLKYNLSKTGADFFKPYRSEDTEGSTDRESVSCDGNDSGKEDRN